MAGANWGSACAATYAATDDRYRADSGSRERRGRLRHSLEGRDQLEQLQRPHSSPPDERNRIDRTERPCGASHYPSMVPFSGRERPNGDRPRDQGAQREMDLRVRQEVC